MGKHASLPTDPRERKIEKWRRHLRCVGAYTDKRKLRAEYAERDPANAKNLDLIGL